MRNRLIWVLLGLVALGVGFWLGGGLRALRFPSGSEGEEAIGRPAPELSFQSLGEADSRRLSDYRGAVVLLNFWATWCPPCRAELPALDRLAGELGPRGLRVLAVSDEDPEVIRRFLSDRTEREIEYGFVRSIPAESPFALALRYRPVSVLIDAQGWVRAVIIGAQSFETFRQMVEPYLPGAHS